MRGLTAGARTRRPPTGLSLAGIPVGVELGEGAVFEVFALPVDGAFDLLESFDEFVDAPVEQILGIEFFEAGEVDGGEEEIAEFFLELPAGAGALQFAEFFFDFGEDVVGVFPVEADAGGFALDFVGFEESRQAPGDFGKDRVGLFFLFFDGFPLPEDFARGGGFGFAEDVRMPANEFVGDGLSHRLEIECAGFAGHLGVEHYLEQQIA